MFEPLLAAPAEIQFHALSAIVALVLGPVAIFRHRRDRLHKVLGYIWVVAMAVAVASSFWIFEIRLLGPFSPIHFLSVFTAYNLYRGVRAAIVGDFNLHRKTMRGLYFWALGVAGLFTLMPGRIMGQVLFGHYQTQGFVAVLALAAASVLIARFRNNTKTTGPSQA